MSRWLPVAGIVVLSTGWILPLYCSADYVITWCEHEAADEHMMHSFPFLSTARTLLGIGTAWSAAVMVCWSWAVSKRSLSPSCRVPAA